MLSSAKERYLAQAGGLWTPVQGGGGSADSGQALAGHGQQRISALGKQHKAVPWGFSGWLQALGVVSQGMVPTGAECNQVVVEDSLEKHLGAGADSGWLLPGGFLQAEWQSAVVQQQRSL